MNTLFVNSDPTEPYLRGQTALAGREVVTLDGISADLLVPAGPTTTLAILYCSAHTILHQMRTGELLPRVKSLSLISPWSYLIMRDALYPNTSGYAVLDGKPTGYTWASVNGALLRVQEMGVGILSIRDESFLSDTVISLINQDREPKRLRVPRDYLWATPAEELLMSLPGIGQDKADAILKECGTAAWAFQALTTDTKLPGIGPETRRKAREALGLGEDQALYVATEQPAPTLERYAESII